MSNNFPASLSALTSSGQASVGGDFRFARVWNSRTTGTGYVKDLTILWSETVSDETTNGLMTAAHSQLKAARLLAEHTDAETKIIDRFRLTAPQVVAELPANTLLDHFDAYVYESLTGLNVHSIKAVIQATYYDQENTETIENVIVPSEQTMLYTASQNFEPYGLEVEAIGVDYANLMANSLTPIQFTVRNTGMNKLENLTITLGKDKTATLNEALRPNESATLTVYYKVGETVSNVAYTITDAGSNITKTGTVYLDYPDIGISQMKVLEEKEGQRTIAVTLYNASDAPLAGSDRAVKVAFYTDNLLTEAANVTYNGSGNSNTITLSDNDLARIDAGACTLVLTYNVKDYVEDTLGEQEIPDGGVYLYADAWAEGTIGTQRGPKRLPEVHSSDNQSAVLLTGAYARTGEKTTLDVVQTNDGTTTATVSLKNNSLQQQSTATLVATLLDEKGGVLETKDTSISGALNGETQQTANVQFSQLGSRVVIHAAASGEDSLTFDGLPVDLDDFVLTNGVYTHDIYDVTATDTLVTAISGSGKTVTINGDAVNSKLVSIVNGQQTIIVKIGDNTYELTIHSDAAPPATEVTVTFDANGGSVTPSSTTTKGGKLESLPTPTRSGYDFLGWYTEETGGDKVTTGTVFTKDSTIYAQWTEDEEPDHGGGGGDGGGTSSYRITVEDGSNGKVTANRKTASAGSTVTLTVTPDDGYQLTDLTVTGRNGKEITLKDKGDGTYTFTMPSSTVTVEAIFTPVVTKPLPFTDVPDDSYYYDAVNWAVSNGVTNGTSATTFSPDNICTRAQMVTFLWRAAGSPTPRNGNNPFVDVSTDAYYYTAVLWAVEQGITNGTGTNTFSPDATVTRSQTVTFLWRYSGSPEASGSSFTDVEANAYYATAVAWAAREGITSGTSATTFSPYNPCTRAQIVTFLYRAQ